jgi:pyruvate dehydrogenase E2 component (dihydrolipoamide acetyltransferase)
MAVEFKLPDIGEGLTEGEITKWLVKEGDVVAPDQPMVEVLTDKATVEIPAPRGGVIAKILVPDGTKVPVGTVIVVIDDKAGGGGSAPASKPAAQPTHGGGGGGSGGHGGGKAPVAPAPAPARPPAPAPREPARQPVAASAPQGAQARQGGANGTSGNGASEARAAVAVDESRVVLAAPATRRLAREIGIDLRAVPGTGPNGRITRTDLEQFQQAGGARVAAGGGAPASREAAPERVPVAAPVVSAEDEHVPLKGVRGKIAEQMLRSKQHSPHFTFADECDVTELVALREQAKEIAKQRNVHLTYLPFVIKALVAAFRQFPTVNSVVDDTKNEFVIRREYNIGIATDTPDGLMVPVVRDVARHTILEIAGEIQRLTEAARDKKIAVHDLKGGTFTITSAGSIGGILATPILNYPEVGILGLYKIADRAVVRDGQIVVRKMMNLTITLDHRIVDGATAARFLNTVIRYLESPNLLLLEAM